MLLSNLSQLAHTPDFHPFDHKDVARVIKASTVGADKLSRREMIAREFARRHVIARRVIAEVRNDVIVPVHQGDAGKQVGHHHIAVLIDIEVARSIRSVEKVYVLAIEREPLNALIAAISNIQHRFSPTCVQNDAMRAGKLTRLFARAAKSTDVFSFAVVLEDVA